MRSGSSPGRIFCIVKLFELLHSQEFAREGGHASFLSSSHPSPPTMPSSALREDHLLRCTKKRDSHSAVPFFCIVKLFELLHSQEFARGGGHAFFLSSAHSLPADNAIERLREDHLLRCTKNAVRKFARPHFLHRQAVRTPAFSGVRARRRARGTIFHMPLCLCSPLFEGRFPNFHAVLSRAQPLQRASQHGAFRRIPHKIGIQPQIAPVRRFEALLGDAR